MEEFINSLGLGIYTGPIILAVLGYFGFIVKDIPGLIWSYVKQKHSSSIQATSYNYKSYKVVSKFLLSKFPLLKKHIMANGLDSGLVFAEGTYTFYYKFLTFVLVDKIRISNVTDGIYYSISVKAIGLKRDQFLAEYEAMFKEEFPEMGMIDVLTQRNGRTIVMSTPRRSIDTVFIPHDTKESLMSLLARFKGSDGEIYNHIGIPKKLGILLVGPPGSGKSSVARAIASYLNMSLYIVSNNGFIDDITCTDTIFLFEDIDLLCKEKRDLSDSSDHIPTFSEVVENKGLSIADHIKRSKDPKIDLHLLLQILDGTMTPNNSVFIATTNSVESLDPALIRPGRFDVRFYIPSLSEDLAKEMCDYYNAPHTLMDGIDFGQPEAASLLQNRIVDNTIGVQRLSS